MASAIAPEPVPRSSTRTSRSFGNRASASSTSVSVSGRGMSTAGDTCSVNPQNSRRPVRYATGSPSRRRRARARNASARSRGNASSPCATSHARSRPSTCASSTCASSGTRPDCASAPRTVPSAAHRSGSFGDEQPQPLVVVAAPAGIRETRLHQHALRRLVGPMRDADDPVEAEVVEAVSGERLRAFGREAAPPGAGHEPVADLDVRRLSRVLEREPADESAGVRARRVPDAEIGIERRIADDARAASASRRRATSACRRRCSASRAGRGRGAEDRRDRRRRSPASRGAASRARARASPVVDFPLPPRRRLHPPSPSAASISAWCSCASAAVRSPRSPSMIASILCSVRLIR